MMGLPLWVDDERWSEARQRLRPIDTSGVAMICGTCGHEALLGQFTRTPIAGELPLNMVQCPKCQHAVERRHGTLVSVGARL